VAAALWLMSRYLWWTGDDERGWRRVGICQPLMLAAVAGVGEGAVQRQREAAAARRVDYPLVLVLFCYNIFLIRQLFGRCSGVSL